MGAFGRAIKKLTGQLPKKAPEKTVSPAQISKLPIAGGTKVKRLGDQQNMAKMLRAADAEIEGLSPKKK